MTPYIILLQTGFINCADVDISEGEASFESEFHKKYFDAAEEKKAGDKIITIMEIMGVRKGGKGLCPLPWLALYVFRLF